MDISLFLRYTAELAMVISAVVSALLPVRNSLKCSRKVAYLGTAAIILLFITVGAILGSRFSLDSNLITYIGMAGFLTLYVTCVNYNITKKMFCFFHGTALSFFCTMYTAYIGAPYDIGPIGLFSPKWGLICLAFSIIITLLFLKDSTIKLEDLLENKNMDQIWINLMFAPILIVAFSIWAMPIEYQNVMAGRVRLISLILFPILPLIYHIIIHLLWWTAEHITRETELKQQNDLLQIEEKRYNELRYYIEQASVIRHDFRHHIGVISELLQMNKTEEAREYIAQFIKSSELEHKSFCANREIDAVAAHYDKLARKHGINIKWRLKIGEQLPFRSSDSCSIIGNLLENAINAVKELSEKKRQIDITLEMRSDQMLALFVRNPYENEIVYDKKKRLISPKADHGIGLWSVESLVNSYNGNLQITAHDGVFEVSIIMFARETP